MTNPISVDVGAMLNAVAECEDNHDSIRSQVISLQDQYGILASTWTGDASTAFASAMSGFYDECNTILTALATLAKNIDDSAIAYNNAHNLTNDAAEALAKQIQSDPVTLPGF
jgi:WXG100 family type VII secretion target